MCYDNNKGEAAWARMPRRPADNELALLPMRWQAQMVLKPEKPLWPPLALPCPYSTRSANVLNTLAIVLQRHAALNPDQELET